MTITKTDSLKHAKVLLSITKGKPLKNYGGNFWGHSRMRCSIIKPEQIAALIENGYAVYLDSVLWIQKAAVVSAAVKAETIKPTAANMTVPENASVDDILGAWRKLK